MIRSLPWTDQDQEQDRAEGTPPIQFGKITPSYLTAKLPTLRYLEVILDLHYREWKGGGVL